MTAPQINSNTPQSLTESLHLHCGNNVDILRSYPDCHFDAIITDPPYGIEFLGKDWDSHTGAIATWQQCLRVLKPGGHLLAFSAARTYHHLATNIESVGFEIRDQLMWIYSSGFPKAQDIGKAIQKRLGVKQTKKINSTDGYNLKNQIGFTENNDVGYGKMKPHTVCTSPEALRWAGWKTALKPGHEPIVMARKPMRGSTIDNIQQHGVGALNIDSSRIPFEDAADLTEFQSGFQHANLQKTGGPTFQGSDSKPVVKRPTGGADGLSRLEFGEREPVKYKDQYKEFVFGAPGTQAKQTDLPTKFEANPQGRYPSNVLGDIPQYQKYFYCPKVSRRERHVGFEQSHIPTNSNGMMSRDAQGQLVNNYTANKPSVGNNHPTVKPVALMRYLIQLVTPKNSTVLDPFMGSGSTGMAARELGHTFVGIDLDPAYVEIALKRIEGWVRTETTRSVQPETATDLKHTDLFDDLFE